MRREHHSGRALEIALNTLATIQVTWFYLSQVPSALDLAAYEQGRERLPFQQRAMMMMPLRWAHNSPLIGRLAAAIAHTPGWFGPHPQGVSPEAVLQAAINLACVVLTGMVARRIYQAASATGLLTALVYPLTLVMITATYSMAVHHSLRFPYDFPAMAFFAAGLYLLYFRWPVVVFAAVFLMGTLNRETTLFLLPLYALSACVQDGVTTTMRWQRLRSLRTLAVVFPLAAAWLGWHVWVTRHFAANSSVEGPRLMLNLGTLLCPIAWPQLAIAAAYLWPLPWLCRRSIADPTLRAWVWLPVIWFSFMLFYGLLMEPRIFGELIPYYACAVALAAEASVIARVEGSEETFDSRGAEPNGASLKRSLPLMHYSCVTGECYGSAAESPSRRSPWAPVEEA